MPFARTWSFGPHTVVASILVLAAAAMPAAADPRAPIVYNYASGAAAQPAAADKATQRIAFRYPGSTASVAPAKPASAGAGWSEPPKPITPRAAEPATSPKLLVQTTPLEPVVEAAPLNLEVTPTTSAATTGLVTVYGDEFEGLPTANGEIFDQSALTAAHPSLPLPSLVQVTNPVTGREVVVRVNDRGPFEDNAVLQVSRQAARDLGIDGAGQAELTFRVIGAVPASEMKRPAPVPAPAAAPTVLREVSARPAASSELLGGDELAGGPVAPAPARRAEVVWPEPPADWGVKPASVKVSAVASGTHYVQLASFADVNNAEALYRGLRADMPVEIVPARVNGAEYFRVRVGPLDSRASAQDLRDRLDALGKGDGRVVTAD